MESKFKPEWLTDYFAHWFVKHRLRRRKWGQERALSESCRDALRDLHAYPLTQGEKELIREVAGLCWARGIFLVCAQEVDSPNFVFAFSERIVVTNREELDALLREEEKAQEVTP